VRKGEGAGCAEGVACAEGVGARCEKAIEEIKANRRDVKKAQVQVAVKSTIIKKTFGFLCALLEFFKKKRSFFFYKSTIFFQRTTVFF
jgi:hypothetical protein